MKSLKERLLEKIRVNADTLCWEWTAAKNKRGPISYGQIWDGEMKLAHRASFEIYCSSIPEGLQVLHRCDNSGCVNPEHLFLGTHGDNMDDKVAKQRQARGITSSHAKLTEADIIAIRAASSDLLRNLAEQYGVHTSTISRIQSGKGWSHLPQTVLGECRL